MILEPPARMASRLKRLKQSLHFMNLLIQVTATTIGILIALGLDQMKVARQNRRNASQALGFIVSDMQANQRRLAKTLESFGSNEKAAMGNLEFLHACRQRKLASKGKASIQDFPTLSLTILQSASWETAVASQAASHLDMRRVQKLAAIFELQRKYEAMSPKSIEVDDFQGGLQHDRRRQCLISSIQHSPPPQVAREPAG